MSRFVASARPRRLFDVAPRAAARPLHDSSTDRRIAHLRRDITALREEIEEREWEIESIEADIEKLTAAAAVWPDRPTLLAVYGAPGNWPVDPIEDTA